MLQTKCRTGVDHYHIPAAFGHGMAEGNKSKTGKTWPIIKHDKGLIAIYHVSKSD